MKICVYGLWHLGSVTAACLASVGHTVVGLDPDISTISSLSDGKAPIFEPGLDDLIKSGIANATLSFDSDPETALYDTNVLWVTFDTPVDDDDHADTTYVTNKILHVLPYLCEDTIILVSSQLPVGSIANLEQYALKNFVQKNLCFAYSPENLRLGKSLEVFLNPDRVIVGTRSGLELNELQSLFLPLSNKIVWMRTESAEMTKHAINAFLAASVTFANEIASICEVVGADAKEVEFGLKTESRIGPKAYLLPGAAFAGGTLARDVAFLGELSLRNDLVTPLLSSVVVSNDIHKTWVHRKLMQHFDSLKGVKVALWGLTYKAGTNTLRRSLAVELCDWLLNQQASVITYDPAVKVLPDRWSGKVLYTDDPVRASKDVDVLIIGTEWNEFKDLANQLANDGKRGLIIVDPNRHLFSLLTNFIGAGFSYIAVGSSTEVSC